MVDAGDVEPPTSGLSNQRSYRLSYTSVILVGREGIRTLTAEAGDLQSPGLTRAQPTHDGVIRRCSCDPPGPLKTKKKARLGFQAGL